MYKTFQWKRSMKREDKSDYLTVTESEIRTKLRINSANGTSSSEDSGIVPDGGYDQITKMSNNLPPDPPPFMHRNNTYLNPDKKQENNKNVIKGSRYLDIIHNEKDIALKEMSSGYKQLPSIRGDIEKPHNYQQLIKLFEQEKPDSN